MKRIAVSIGDLNGVGPAIALLMHREISRLCHPVYCVSPEMIAQAAKLLGVTVPEDFETVEVGEYFTICPGAVDAASGAYSYHSFAKAVELTRTAQTDAVVTLPIHKEAWSLAGLSYKGHTDMLRDLFDAHAIMMLGKEGFYVALFTEHIPYRMVPEKITLSCVTRFLEMLYANMPEEKIAVLGLNPHAGDGGVLGDEERIITQAIAAANESVGRKVFEGPIVPDTAFTPHMRERYRLFVAMYHDQGLAPLKALYFEESINVSLNLPIIRTSVDHGTAFDIAYGAVPPSTLSYRNAIMSALRLASRTK